MCSKCGECGTRCGNISLTLVEQKKYLTSCHETKPYARTKTRNGDHYATAETPTAVTATTASGVDENDKDPENKHEYVNTETDDII